MSNVNIGGTKIPGLSYPVLNRNSAVYIDARFLDSYVDIVHPDNPTWADVNDSDGGLIRGQIYVESLYYQGSQWWSDQILQWPRYPVQDKSGQLLSSNQTPYDIFNAVAEAAYWETKEPGILQPQEEVGDIYPLQSTEVAAGSVSSKKAWDTANKRVKSSAERLSRLQGYLRQWTVSTGTFVQIART